MSNSPFFNSSLDVPQQKCSNYTQDCLESTLSVLSDPSSFTSNNQLSDDQLISQNFRDLNVSPLYCDCSRLEDVSKNISFNSYGNMELQNHWKCDQEKTDFCNNESKNYVPKSNFLKEAQEALCDKTCPLQEDQMKNEGIKSAEFLSAKDKTVKIEDDNVHVAFMNFSKVETEGGIYCTCSICHASLKSQSHAILHLQEHAITTPYKCIWCEKLSQTVTEAKAHQQSHDWSICENCGQHILTEKVEKHRTECDPMVANPALQMISSAVGNSSSCEETDGDTRIEPANNRGTVAGLYTCEECNECFPAYEELMNHKEVQHFGGKEDFDLDTIRSYPRSSESSEDNVVNNVPALNENDPPKQMKTGKKNPSKAARNFTCSTCGKSFRASKPLREHEVVHTGARNYACEICGKAFGTRANMKIHLATHSDKRPFLCTICNAAFRQKDSLKVHLRKHNGERPFACTVCNMRFDRNFTLKNHLLTHGEEKSFVCVVCGKAFTTRGGLNNHERLHLKDPNKKKARKPPSKPGTGNWICDECGKLYSTRSNLRMHQRSHEPVAVTHPCYVCGRVYKHKDSLEVHMRRHTHDRPYPCPTCGRTFYRNWTLKLHILTHTGEKPHKCPIEDCDKAFTQSSSLCNHVQSHHKQAERAKLTSGQEGGKCAEEASPPNSISHTESIVNATQKDAHLQNPPIFDSAAAISNLIIPPSMEGPLTTNLADKVGVEDIHSSVLDGLVTPEGALVDRQDSHLNSVSLGDPSSLCLRDVEVPLNLVWENTDLPMDITNIHLPQSEQPPLPSLSQSMDPVYIMPDNIPLLVSVDGQLYQDNIKMASLPNFVSQLR